MKRERDGGSVGSRSTGVRSSRGNSMGTSVTKPPPGYVKGGVKPEGADGDADMHKEGGGGLGGRLRFRGFGSGTCRFNDHLIYA